MKEYKYSKTIRVWLLVGLIMLIGQVVLGGITRLTGSGLSITKWDIISGVIPPLNALQWEDAFSLYKKTPQFSKINATFTLSNFKFIYFWEYFHRLWVRSLGIIFLIPFVIFILRKKIDKTLVKHLLLVVILTMLTASAGWIMVKSGLVNRPWVNAYKLGLHFILAVFVIWAMVKTIAYAYSYGDEKVKNNLRVKWVLAVLVVQMIIAGLMAGMKAGLYYPSWPSMNGVFVPEVLLNAANWHWLNMTNYDSNVFAPALIQFSHRILAYVLVVLVVLMFVKEYKIRTGKMLFWLKTTTGLVLIQLGLGVLTVLNVQGEIPLVYGVLHQLVGLLFFISLLFYKYSSRKKA
ncbi:MAG: COX15/CtaA family protein [Flavobacteriaceae bacterium]|nr:COX15/CtaA family protein [Flavobacteriaceae bacterium]